MPSYHINFRFSGRIADKAMLDGGDVVHYTRGARQLLALHAYFFTTGIVPGSRYLNRTANYSVYKTPSSAGSFLDAWWVEILQAAAGGILATYGVTAINASANSVYSYTKHLKAAVMAALKGGREPPPEELRREPYFESANNGTGRGRAPDVEMSWYELQSRTADVLRSVAVPIGRSADELVIGSEEFQIATINLETYERLLSNLNGNGRSRGSSRAPRPLRWE